MNHDAEPQPLIILVGERSLVCLLQIRHKHLVIYGYFKFLRYNLNALSTLMNVTFLMLHSFTCFRVIL